jgi:hypothetical protein
MTLDGVQSRSWDENNPSSLSSQVLKDHQSNLVGIQLNPKIHPEYDPIIRSLQFLRIHPIGSSIENPNLLTRDQLRVNKGFSRVINTSLFTAQHNLSFQPPTPSASFESEKAM